MGDIADMMLCGVLCSCCGVYVGDDVGYPVTCPDCESEDDDIEDSEMTDYDDDYYGEE